MSLRFLSLITLVFSLGTLSCAVYNIQVLHSNAQPLAPDDELTFLNSETESSSMHESDGSLINVRCPLDIVAFVSRDAQRSDPAPRTARIALQLEQGGAVVPMFPVIMTPHLKHVIAAGTPFTSMAGGAAEALKCSASHDAVSMTFRARALLLDDHDSTGQTLAESVPFRLRIICGTVKLLSTTCAGSVAPTPASACELQVASPWSSPFTSVGQRTSFMCHFSPHTELVLAVLVLPASALNEQDGGASTCMNRLWREWLLETESANSAQPDFHSCGHSSPHEPCQYGYRDFSGASACDPLRFAVLLRSFGNKSKEICQCDTFEQIGRRVSCSCVGQQMGAPLGGAEQRRRRDTAASATSSATFPGQPQHFGMRTMQRRQLLPSALHGGLGQPSGLGQRAASPTPS
jgi:hypothetical protein